MGVYLLNSPEERDHEHLVALELGPLGLGLELADELLAASGSVHGVDEGEVAVGVGLHGALHGGPLVAVVVAVIAVSVSVLFPLILSPI